MVNQMHQHTNASGGMLVAASDAALSIIHPHRLAISRSLLTNHFLAVHDV
jgi:hypothetical protein